MTELDPSVLAALRFALEAHGGQLRKDGRTLYVVHPIGVMRRLSTHLAVTDPELLQAALLHDVLEDTAVTAERLGGEFGPRVLHYVEELTLPPEMHGPTVPTEAKTRRLLEDLRRMSWESVLVKLCDRWDNLTDVRAAPWRPEKVDAFFRQSEAMIAAVEERRGHAPEPTPLSSQLRRGLEGARGALVQARDEARLER